MAYAIKADNVTVRFPRGFIGRSAQLFGVHSDQHLFTALNDVSLTVNEGDRVGIIGLNGAGKTTLLRVLAGAIPPQRGRIRINGRVQALLSSTAGVLGERSGRENIYLRGYALGLTRRQIAGLLDEIIDFAELDEFIDAPQRTYSQGMSLRLMFAIATACPPDILIMDEWIGVGDKRFQEKALTRMQHFVEQAGTLIVASHSKGIIQRQCSSAILMEYGNVLGHGGVEEMNQLYDARTEEMKKLAG